MVGEWQVVDIRETGRDCATSRVAPCVLRKLDPGPEQARSTQGVANFGPLYAYMPGQKANARDKEHWCPVKRLT